MPSGSHCGPRRGESPLISHWEVENQMLRSLKRTLAEAVRRACAYSGDAKSPSSSRQARARREGFHPSIHPFSHPASPRMIRDYNVFVGFLPVPPLPLPALPLLSGLAATLTDRTGGSEAIEYRPEHGREF